MLIKNDYKPLMVEKKAKRLKDDNHISNVKVIVCLLAFISLFVALIARGVYLNKVIGSGIQSEFEKRTTRTLLYKSLRGKIVDRNNTIVAMSVPVNLLTISPKYIEKPIPQDKIIKLSKIIGQDPNFITQKITDKSINYFVFKNIYLTSTQADEIRALRIPTVSFEKKEERHYVHNNLFSHVIGFSNSNSIGLEGIELMQNKNLSGEDGLGFYVKDGRNDIIEEIQSNEKRIVKNGDDIKLTLSYNIQELAKNALERGINVTKAKAGGAVVLDAKTGEVLAMVSYPDYNPNQYKKYKVETRSNFTLGNLFEPGSILKPLIVAKALDMKKITPNQGFNTSPYVLAKKKITDTHNYPYLNVNGIIQKSSNVGMTRIVEKMDDGDLYDFYREIGFGRKMNMGLNGEQYAYLKKAKNWHKLDKAVMSFGYGLQTNMLNMASTYTIFTNDGKMIKPRVLIGQEKIEHQVISAKAANTIRDMMISVTEKGGTGTIGAVEGFDVAAKTGTAKKLLNGSYNNNQYVTSFYGFAPAKEPKYIVGITLDQPQTTKYGGTAAGPVFKEIMSELLTKNYN